MKCKVPVQSAGPYAVTADVPVRDHSGHQQASHPYNRDSTEQHKHLEVASAQIADGSKTRQLELRGWKLF